MNFVTPVKKDQSHQPAQANTQEHKREVVTNYKIPQNWEDEKETPKKSNEYVLTKDRIIRTACFKHIQANRGRIIDWFLQVFSFYGLGWQGYWICVQLLDSLIGDHDYVNVKNIHIVGIVCIFISSKYSNVQPLRLSQVISQICHNRFSKLQILKEQQKIFGLVFKNSYIQRHTIYHYLIEEFEHQNQSLLCEVLQWIVLVWTKTQSALIDLGVQTYKQLIRKIMYYVSRGLELECLYSILNENESKWGTSACAWRKYSYKIHL